MAGRTGSSSATADPVILLTARWAAILWLAVGLSAAAMAAQPLSERTPLIDFAARAEVDGYRRLDQAIQRSDSLPDVFDPAVYSAGASLLDLRRLVLDHILWVRGAEASHLEMIETLPARLEAVSTDEPYREAFVEHYRSTTPERSRRIRAYYEAAHSAAEIRAAFLDLVATGGVSPRVDGFAFEKESDAASYRGLVEGMNRSFHDQNERISAYQAWEIEQKAALRHFRDQL